MTMRSSSFLLAALAVVLVCAQGPARAAGCTTRSFTIPSWLIQDVQRADGIVSFTVWNRAFNYTANLSCEAKVGLNTCSIQGTPSSLSMFEAAIEISDKPTTYHLKQLWTCNDRERALTFTATGNTTAPSHDYASPLLVRGSLTTPVSLTPSYADGPTGHDTPGCTARSETPTWELSAIHYTDEPGDGSTTPPFRHLHLVVTNPANGYQASCMPAGVWGGGGGDDDDDAPGPARLACAGYEFQSARVGQYPVTTQAVFDARTMRFGVNQTWFCDDLDTARPLQITATGSTTLALTCTTAPSGATGRLNRYCTGATEAAPAGVVTVSGQVGAVVALPAYALEDPAPGGRGDGCTLTSIFEPRWRFSAFAVAGGDGVSFEMILLAQDRGFQYPIPVYQGGAVRGGRDGEGWYECEIGADGGNGPPLWPYWCEFRYDAAEGSLEVWARWECRDLDAANPVDFSGVSVAAINSTLSCETVNGQSRCTTTDPGHTWIAPISNVTWGPAA